MPLLHGDHQPSGHLAYMNRYSPFGCLGVKVMPAKASFQNISSDIPHLACRLGMLTPRRAASPRPAITGIAMGTRYSPRRSSSLSSAPFLRKTRSAVGGQNRITNNSNKSTSVRTGTQAAARQFTSQAAGVAPVQVAEEITLDRFHAATVLSCEPADPGLSITN